MLASVGILTWLGLGLFLFGLTFEVVGDWQLDRFLAQAEGRPEILETGLWRYTRHPNYFGEVTLWWGIWLMVSTLPGSIFALIGPLTITFLILKVSGVPLLERAMANNQAYQEYAKRTNAFFPGRPRVLEHE